jgi:hypothetical protein
VIDGAVRAETTVCPAYSNARVAAAEVDGDLTAAGCIFRREYRRGGVLLRTLGEYALIGDLRYVVNIEFQYAVDKILFCGCRLMVHFAQPILQAAG